IARERHAHEIEPHRFDGWFDQIADWVCQIRHVVYRFPAEALGPYQQKERAKSPLCQFFGEANAPADYVKSAHYIKLHKFFKSP
ncbi:MAG: hypothetical protein V3R81_03015, partial [Gammaproteobacteria bacterium]